MGIHVSFKKITIGGSIIAIIVGLIFAVVGVFVFVNTHNNKNYYREVEGVITNITSETNYDSFDDEYETRYYVYVEYTVDGETYSNVEYPTYHAGMREGDKVTVTYDYRNPDKAVQSVSSSNWISVIFVIVGGIVILLGVGAIISKIKRAKEVCGDVVSSVKNISSNENNPYSTNNTYNQNYNSNYNNNNNSNNNNSNPPYSF